MTHWTREDDCSVCGVFGPCAFVERSYGAEATPIGVNCGCYAAVMRPLMEQRVRLQRPKANWVAGERLFGVHWHPANRERDTVNRLRIGFWWAMEIAWWPRWAR